MFGRKKFAASICIRAFILHLAGDNLAASMRITCTRGIHYKDKKRRQEKLQRRRERNRQRRAEEIAEQREERLARLREREREREIEQVSNYILPRRKTRLDQTARACLALGVSDAFLH